MCNADLIVSLTILAVLVTVVLIWSFLEQVQQRKQAEQLASVYKKLLHSNHKTQINKFDGYPAKYKTDDDTEWRSLYDAADRIDFINQLKRFNIEEPKQIETTIQVGQWR